MEKLLIIDGSSLLSTSFYGTARDYTMAKTPEQKEEALSKLLKTSKGVYTNGVYTFMKTMMNMIKNQNPTHLSVVFDTTRETFRRELSADYKANRKETPYPLKEQFITTQNLLKEIGVPVYMGEYEADDYAGSLTKRFEDEIPVYLHTKDEDYLQLVSERSRVWLVTSKADEMFDSLGINKREHNIPDGVFEYNPLNMHELKGIHPIQIIDYKAICGDTSDNIPGVRGCGEKAVIPLLNEYGSVECIYDVIDDLDEKEEKELKLFFKEHLGISRSPIKNLLEGRDSAFLSKTLATIKTDIEEMHAVNLEDLVLNIDRDKYKEKILELEMKSLVDMYQ